MAQASQRQGNDRMIIIDGSEGEGGGQVLRTALTLSMVTGKPFTIENIRARRSKPGLMRQHLACVKAAAAISGASHEGAVIGSGKLIFRPGALKAGNYRFDIGSAGSTTLVLQTIMLALAALDAPSTIVVTGGTHNMAAPCFDFLGESFLPIIRRMGFRIEAECLRRGFYPAGGGEIRMTIGPSEAHVSLVLDTAGRRLGQGAKAIVSHLPYDIARREAAAFADAMGWTAETCVAHSDAAAIGPGNVLTAHLECEHVTEIFTTFGRQGVSGDRIAQELAKEIKDHLSAGAPVGHYLADQLLLPMVLTKGGRFVTSRPSAHCSTNIEVIRSFLNTPIASTRLDDRRWMISVGEQG